jgi:hypothetical protein
MQTSSQQGPKKVPTTRPKKALNPSPEHQVTPASVSSLLAQMAAFELGIRAFTGCSPLESMLGKQSARCLFGAMGMAAVYRMVSHMNGPNRWILARFDE